MLLFPSLLRSAVIREIARTCDQGEYQRRTSSTTDMSSIPDTKLENAKQVATQVDNRVEEAKALIMGPPGSMVILRFTRGDTMHDHTHASFEVSLVRESVKHPPSLPVGEVGVEEELDWALLPEQVYTVNTNAPKHNPYILSNAYSLTRVV